MISVVIPALNEAPRLGALLGALAGETTAHEVIVVDGGSADGTVAVAKAMGARVIRTVPGRGVQLVAGAEKTRGEVLLFLHADSRFPRGGLAAVARALDENRLAPGGNFRLLFDGSDRFSRWLEGFYGWIRARGVYYGDSAVFCRRDAYVRLGGIRAIALMEDYDFVRRLERAGPTLCIEDPPLMTSSRRFRGRRPAAIVWGWLWLHALYHLGVSPERLARFYDSTRNRAAADQDPPSFKRQSYS